MDESNLKVRIEISVEQENYSGGLRLAQQFTLSARDFLEMAKILGQFDDLAKKISAEDK